MSKCPSTEILIFYYRCTVFDGLFSGVLQGSSVSAVSFHVVIFDTTYESISISVFPDDKEAMEACGPHTGSDARHRAPVFNTLCR